jgi:very-short-patch-repair endonuclease
MAGAKFRRQHAVPPYVIGFYCVAMKIGIELDGSQHSESTDAVRTRFLEAQGIKLLRFWDNDVLGNTDAVFEAILGFIQPRTLTPTPLQTGEGLKQAN